MSFAAEKLTKTVPAQLGFLAIYNPSLGTTDETIADQVVYYTSPDYQERKRRKPSVANASAQAAQDTAHERKNEQLRRIGLAQGMVEFGKSFSDGTPIDTIETEKSRIILHELELGWWILASINLTILPKAAKAAAPAGGQTPEQDETIEYSSREVKPAVLLLADLTRAHSTFLLHHAPSIDVIFGQTKRSEFEKILSRYWDTFLSTWNVLMHGNPASNLYGGIKIAACGELGVGVGEEERGSGEREVLEGLIGRIDGLVDVVVSRFGDFGPNNDILKGASGIDAGRTQPSLPWLGSGNDPAPEDGVVFLGTGALLRTSLRNVSHWVEDLYRWGPSTYGVLDISTPHSRRRVRKLGQRASKDIPSSKNGQKKAHGASSPLQSPVQESPMTTIPPMPFENAEDPRDRTGLGQRGPSIHRDLSNAASIDSASSKSGKFISYLKFGYGSHWTLGGTTTPTSGHNDAPNIPTADTNTKSQLQKPLPGAEKDKLDSTPSGPDDTVGHYLIGLMGDIENENGDTIAENQDNSGKSDLSSDYSNGNVSSRTLIVELQNQDAHIEASARSGATNTDNNQPLSKNTGFDPVSTSDAVFDTQGRQNIKRLRVAIYANKPFIFAFLFEPETEALASGNLYRSLHYQLSPLMKPLLRSTTFRASKPEIATISSNKDGSAPIYDLVWDPELVTLNSTIPNIPDPFHSPSHPPGQIPWSRIEALNTHMQILNTYIATINDEGELERTSKTGRGWWVVWTKIPERRQTSPGLTSGLIEDPFLGSEDSFESNSGATTKSNASHVASTSGSNCASGAAHPDQSIHTHSRDGAQKYKVIFLIRRASDYTTTRSRFASGSSTADDSGWIGAPGKLAQGIGIDTRKYIEGLLNLNR